MAKLHHMKFGSQVEGILVVCDGPVDIVGIHNFSGRNKAFWEFLEQVHARREPWMNPSLYWFYFPLNDQEKIQGVFARKWEHPASRTNIDGLIVSAPIPWLISGTDRLGTYILRERHDIRSSISTHVY